jgi:hypothetical protein
MSRMDKNEILIPDIRRGFITAFKDVSTTIGIELDKKKNTLKLFIAKS